MKESLLDKVISAKRDYEVGQVIFYNNGQVGTETNSFAKKMDKIYDSVELEMLTSDLCSATASYARRYELDSMEVGLQLGLIYNANDVDEKRQIKPGAKPVNNIVRYYDIGFNSYLDGVQTNEHEYGEHNVTHQGYIHYDKLVEAFNGSGVEFTGPESFEEFKELILSGVPFDISLIADFKKKQQSRLFGK